MQKVRKAVVPAAGFGMRFLPASRALPKEMFPLVDKPLVQYAVEEAVASGIEEIIFVTRAGKKAIEEYFGTNGDLASAWKKKGQRREVTRSRLLARMAEFRFVRQKVPLGLGHAVGCARQLVGDEPFVVLLPDDVIDSRVPCTRQLLEVYGVHGGSIVATQKVQGVEIERGGALQVETVSNTRWRRRLFRVTDLVEKPRRDEAPSRYGVIGRYVLEPEIFSCIDILAPGRGGELQLTDALRLLAKKRAVYAFAFEGQHSDGGNKLGFLCATVGYGIKHREVGPAFRRYLKSLKF